MADSHEEKPTEEKPTVENRWWAEIKTKDAPVAPKRGDVAGAKFFKIAEGYDQDRARDNLTDQNLRLLHEARPEEGQWSHLHLLDEHFPERELEKIKRVVDLPSYARGVVIDCGRTIRLLITGTPVGERILELALVDQPSLDCWIKNDWVQEELYNSREEALATFRQQIRDYLSPQAIASDEENQARA